MLKSDKLSWDIWVAAQEDDSYGLECFRYAEAWADLMEKAMTQGKQLEDVAEQTSHDADTNGITGFMYGITVSILSKMWVHGERLRCWHNEDLSPTQAAKANASGAVLNPAIINISV